MALTRRMLSAMGIEAEKVDEIINAHAETVTGLKEEIDKYKADALRVESMEKELDALKKNGDKSPYKVKYEALVEERDNLQKEFEDYKSGIAAKETAAKKKDAYRQMLRECGIAEKRIEAVLKVSDFESLEFGEDGKVKDSDKLMDDIKKEWSEFITTEQQRGANVPNPPANNPSDKPLTREEIVKIKDTAERQKAWQEFLDNERKK